ncbi:MAG: hypothetical protein QOF07_2678 [Bradyrhizobium sp.]|nr:hypothetical protein [Bradyrhizobium sp.]
MERTGWAELSEPVRRAITARTGPVLSAKTASDGLNSAIAMAVRTTTNTIFVKGMRSDHPGVVTQHREAMINPHVLSVSPRLRWHIDDVDGWNLLGFDHIPGRPADYTPGSPDLPKVIAAMRRLGQVQCPDLPIKQADKRWADYVDDPMDLEWLRGDTLLHTDYNPLNILIHDSGAHIIDWAWPTRGAALIDPACLILRLIAAGHTPAQAETSVAQAPAWNHAPKRAIAIFAVANSRLWRQIATDDPHPWKTHMAAVVDQWAQHRLHGRHSHRAPAPQPARAR